MTDPAAAPALSFENPTLETAEAALATRRASATADFFQIELVGTHPTGLIVTGRFENNQRSHMMATAVREANPSEIEWLRATQDNSPAAS